MNRLLKALRRRRARATEPPEAVAPAAEPVRRRRRRPPAEPAFDDELERLEAEAQHARNRLDLYRARVIGGSPSPTSPVRLRELERSAAAAAERLAFARRTRLRNR